MDNEDPGWRGAPKAYLARIRHGPWKRVRPTLIAIRGFWAFMFLAYALFLAISFGIGSFSLDRATGWLAAVGILGALGVLGAYALNRKSLRVINEEALARSFETTFWLQVGGTSYAAVAGMLGTWFSGSAWPLALASALSLTSLL